jgi:DNA processing protein
MTTKKINPNSKDYPRLLKEIYDPPTPLYVLGNLKPKNELMIAVVGSRKPTEYAKELIPKLIKGLVKHKFTIVSGLALGIDTLVHEETLKHGGKTIAVLGSGLKNIYPKANIDLARSILQKGGAILSEYSPTTEPRPYHFPKRNRIISGLSLGTVVIEAAKRSGSLITARMALEQNREVFAIPGSILSLNSKGTNQLIQEGAKLVTSVKDIIEEFK